MYVMPFMCGMYVVMYDVCTCDIFVEVNLTCGV